MVQSNTTETLKQDLLVEFILPVKFHRNIKNMFVSLALLSSYLNFHETK